MQWTSVNDGRVHACYEFSGIDDPERVAQALVVEETIEYPRDLVEDKQIQDHVIGRVEEMIELDKGRSAARISYSADDVGGELPQLLSMLFGNCSLWPGVRLAHVELPDSLLEQFPGPRFGVAGVRALTGAVGRPLLATAIKPLGSSPDVLAQMAYELAAGGMDIIKDDQGLANQRYAPFEERVGRVAESVRRANEEFGHHALYAPCINGPTEWIDRHIAFALKEGAGALMVLPGIGGFDSLRYLASRDDINVPILAHPSLLGAFTASNAHGMAPELVYGLLPRLSGADFSIYPHAGGRFSFPLSDCEAIRDSCAAQLGTLRPIFPTPGGGLTMERIEEVTEFYGSDVALLIGGDLHRGDLRANARRFRELAEGAAVPG